MGKVDVAVTIAPEANMLKDLKCDLVNEKANIDIVELRLDQNAAFNLEEVENILQELKALKLDAKILVTYRTSSQGGKGNRNGAEYYALLKLLIQVKGYDMIDIEWIEKDAETLKSIISEAQRAGLEVVLSQHDFKQTPNIEALKFTYFKMHQLGADIIKVAVMPKEPQDVLNLLEALQVSSESIETKSVGISMSHLGLISRTAQGVFGGAISYGCLGEPQAPGQIHVGKLKSLLKLYEINK